MKQKMHAFQIIFQKSNFSFEELKTGNAYFFQLFKFSLHIVAGATGPCNSIFGENYLFIIINL